MGGLSSPNPDDGIVRLGVPGCTWAIDTFV